MTRRPAAGLAGGIDVHLWTQYAGGYCISIYPEAPIEMHGGNRVFGAVLIANPGRYRLRIDYSATSAFEKTFTAFSEPFEVR